MYGARALDADVTDLVFAATRTRHAANRGGCPGPSGKVEILPEGHPVAVPEPGDRPDGPRAEPDHFPLAATDDLNPVLAGALRLLRVRPVSDGVSVDHDALVARFGPWSLSTPLANIAGVETGGPYRVWKVVGPRLSLSDRGLTFGTSARAGVCIRFREPVAGIEPTGLLRHPSLTVTVAEPELLVARLNRAPHS